MDPNLLSTNFSSSFDVCESNGLVKDKSKPVRRNLKKSNFNFPRTKFLDRIELDSFSSCLNKTSREIFCKQPSMGLFPLEFSVIFYYLSYQRDNPWFHHHRKNYLRRVTFSSKTELIRNLIIFSPSFTEKWRTKRASMRIFYSFSKALKKGNFHTENFFFPSFPFKRRQRFLQ